MPSSDDKKIVFESSNYWREFHHITHDLTLAGVNNFTITPVRAGNFVGASIAKSQAIANFDYSPHITTTGFGFIPYGTHLTALLAGVFQPGVVVQTVHYYIMLEFRK